MSSTIQPNREIPQNGPFIYGFQNNNVRNVTIKTMMQGWAVPEGESEGTKASATVISIAKTEDGSIKIDLLYGVGSKYEEEFSAVVTDPNERVNLSFIGDSFVSVKWETSNGYPVVAWGIPVRDILLITVNRT